MTPRRIGTVLASAGAEEAALEAARRWQPALEWSVLSKAALRGRGARGAATALRAVRAHAVAAYCEDLESDADRTLLALALLLPRAGTRALVDASGRVRVIGTAWVLRAMPRLALESLAALAIVAAGAAWLIVPWRRTVDTCGPGDWVLYVRMVSGGNQRVGGGFSHLKGVTDALGTLGRPVRLLANQDIPPGLVGDASVVAQHPFPSILPEASDLLYNLRVASVARARHCRDRPAFVYQRHALLSVAGYLAARSLRVPLVLEYNGSEAWARRHWGNGRLVGLIGRMERHVLRRATLVLAVSEPLREELLGWGVSADRIALAPNGVDAAEFDPVRAAPAAADVRRRYAIPAAAPVVGFVGTFGPWHGTEVLAAAIPTVVAACPDARFLIIGDGGSRHAFEASVAAAGAAHAVVMTGAVDRAAVPGHLAACDILVSPHVPMPDGSRFFGSPTKLFEYMAMARPIVASRLEQLAEVLEDGVTAILVTPGDAADLARGLGEAIALPDGGRTMGAAARRNALAAHDWTAITARWLGRLPGGRPA